MNKTKQIVALMLITMSQCANAQTVSGSTYPYQSMTPIPHKTKTIETETPPAVKKPQQEEVQADLREVWPVYTLPITTILSDSLLITPLVGKVPIKGNVAEPYRFQIKIGHENLVANGHNVAGVREAIMSGIASGDRNQSCVRGGIDVMTFVFEDGTIHTVTADAKKPLAYIADSWGKPCIRGQYIDNMGAYMSAQAKASFVEGLAEGISIAHTKLIKIEENGEEGDEYARQVDGNKIVEYAVGNAVSRTAKTYGQYVRDRAEGTYDVVYVPQAQTVQIIIQQSIPIDYTVGGRKINYLNEYSEASYE